MEYNNILVETDENIAVLTINRPAQLNALNSETISELGGAFKALESDGNVKAIIITGSGEKAFVAGADIKEFYQFNGLINLNLPPIHKLKKFQKLLWYISFTFHVVSTCHETKCQSIVSDNFKLDSILNLSQIFFSLKLVFFIDSSITKKLYLLSSESTIVIQAQS